MDATESLDVTTAFDVGSSNVGDTLHAEADSRKASEMDWAAWRAECTWQKLWKERSWGQIFGHFAKVLLLTLIPSVFDLVTDALSTRNFIYGTDYMKQTVNLSLSHAENCTSIGYYNKFKSDGETVTEYYEVSCHETDPIWGYLTLSFIFLPGWQGAMRLNVVGCYSCLTLLFSTFCFPVMMIGVKILALFIPGNEMEKLTDHVTGMEGTYESTFQFLLNLFIILSRGDRRPSSIQLVSLLASLLMILKFQIEEFLTTMHGERHQFLDKIKRAAPLFPMFLTNIVFKLGSIAVVAAVFRYWAILALVVSYVLALLIAKCAFKVRIRKAYVGGCPHAVNLLLWVNPGCIGIEISKKESMDNLLTNNIAWFCIHPILLSICAILTTIESELDHIKMFVQDPAYERNILHHNLIYLWALIAVILVCGLTSAVLIYFQIWLPFKEEEIRQKKVSNH